MNEMIYFNLVYVLSIPIIGSEIDSAVMVIAVPLMLIFNT